MSDFRNRARVLRTLYRMGKASPSEISHCCGLTPSVCARYAKDLAAHKLATVNTTTTPHGKAMSVYSQTKSHLAAVAIHICENSTSVAAYDISGKLAGDILFRDADSEAYEETIFSAVESLLSTSGHTFCAIGLTAAGPASRADGILRPTSRFGGIELTGFEDELKEAFGLPVFSGYDAQCGALCVMSRDMAAERGILCYISAGRSIDMAIFTDGKLLSGSCGLAGLLGHTTISHKDDRCYCGNRGCLEGFCSTARLMEDSDMSLFGLRENRSIEDIRAAYLDGDTGIIRDLENMAAYLAIGLVNVIDLLNPSHIVVGGDFARIGDLLAAPVHSVIKQRVMPEAFSALTVSTVGDVDAALAGAAVGAFDMLLNGKKIAL